MAHQPSTVLVFGEVMIELSDVQADTARIGVAGDTFNTAVYLARAGISVGYVTALGNDAFSDRIVAVLQAENIDTRSVLKMPNKSPGLYAIELDEHGERSFTYWRSNSAAKSFFNAPNTEKIISDMAYAKSLYLSGITLSLFDEQSRNTIINILRSIHKSGGRVVFDTNYRANGWKSKQQAVAAVEAIMPYISTALPTLEDEQNLFGDVDTEACIARWHNAGAKEVVVKAGGRGAYSTETGWVKPLKNINPVDTTGAGDSFNGAYIAARLSGTPVKQAIVKGHELAAKVLMTNGAIL